MKDAARNILNYEHSNQSNNRIEIIFSITSSVQHSTVSLEFITQNTLQGLPASGHTYTFTCFKKA